MSAQRGPPPPKRPPPPPSSGSKGRSQISRSPPPPPPGSQPSKPPPPRAKQTPPPPPRGGGGGGRSSLSSSSRVPKSFDISQLPSLRDGMSAAEEATKRRKTCRFLEEAGRILRLPRLAVATSMVFLHRFFAKHSFAKHDRFEVAVACILLAAKTEESPKKLNVVIEECYKLKQRASADSNAKMEEEEFAKLKERILLLERVILHTIGFELSIDHPYKFLVDQIKTLTQRRLIEYEKPPVSSSTKQPLSASQVQSKLLNNLMQAAMNFSNDSMHTSLCLQYPPKLIAIACVYLSAHYHRIRPTGGKNWLSLFQQQNMDVEILASICMQIIELIADKKGQDMTVFKSVRADLDRLRSTKRSASDVPSPPGAKRPRT